MRYSFSNIRRKVKKHTISRIVGRINWKTFNTKYSTAFKNESELEDPVLALIENCIITIANNSIIANNTINQLQFWSMIFYLNIFETSVRIETVMDDSCEDCYYAYTFICQYKNRFMRGTYNYYCQRGGDGNTGGDMIIEYDYVVY